MKHINYALLFSMFFFCNAASFANPGDTTVVITSPLLNADGSASYDTLIVLPTTKTYRKIFVVYTLNSHACSVPAIATNGTILETWP